MIPEIKTGKVQLMNFYDALREVLENKRRVSRLDWDSNEEYGFLLADGVLGIHHPDGDHVWKIRDGDAIATDWFTLPQSN